MKSILQIIVIVLILAGFTLAANLTKNEISTPFVTNFEECVAMGNPVMESYPRQCRHEDMTFVEDITKVPRACTMEAKLCPDGTAVGRTGPNCEFAKCPGENSNRDNSKPINKCTKDSDCPSPQYLCEETQGSGTVCSSTDPSCTPTHTTIAGECKLKEGNRCSVDSDCVSGNLCNKNICTSPIGRKCNGPTDNSCPTDFECVQGCGPPVARQDDPPPPYFCQLKGYDRPCPICLAEKTLIDTPTGSVRVEDLQIDDPVWTVSNSGKRVDGVVVEISKTRVPNDHQMVNLVLEDRRTFQVSPGHPTIDGRVVGDLSMGDLYDGSRVVTSERVAYKDEFTYDLLSSGETGFYFANGILLDSTLRKIKTGRK